MQAKLEKFSLLLRIQLSFKVSMRRKEGVTLGPTCPVTWDKSLSLSGLPFDHLGSEIFGKMMPNGSSKFSLFSMLIMSAAGPLPWRASRIAFDPQPSLKKMPAFFLLFTPLLLMSS